MRAPLRCYCTIRSSVTACPHLTQLGSNGPVDRRLPDKTHWPLVEKGTIGGGSRGKVWCRLCMENNRDSTFALPRGKACTLHLQVGFAADK